MTTSRRRIGPGMLLCAMVAALFAGGGSAAAQFSGATSASHAISTLSVGAPTGAIATTADDCASVSLSWTAAPAGSHVDSYRIEYKEGSGAWTTLATAAGTSYVDAVLHNNTTVYYRIFGRHASSGWESLAPAETMPLDCGVGAVVDLAAAQGCSVVVLSWSAAANATRYDLEHRVNGGAWASLATNLSAPGYTDATSYPAGATIEYRVLPRRGGAQVGSWSNVAVVAGWDSFRITSVTLADAAVPGSLRAGDTITVTFNKPAKPSSLASTSIYTRRGNPRPGLYIGTVTSDMTGIGRVATATNFFGANATYAGTVTWSPDAKTMTWTATGTGTTMGALTGVTWEDGTGITCEGGTSTPSGSTPAISGQW